MGGIMIDSGSTFSYLISNEYRVFVQAFHSALDEALRRANRTFPAVKRLHVGIVETWNPERSNTTASVWIPPWIWRFSPR